RQAALLRPARSSDRGGRQGLGPGRAHGTARAPPAQRRVLQAHVGDRVRGEVRRRRAGGPARGRRRARRRVADVEDAALDLPRLPRLEGGERPARERHRSAAGAVPSRAGQGGRPDDRRAAAVGDPRGAHPVDARRPEVREPRRDLRGARVRRAGAPPPRLPGARGERAVDRGDLAPDHPARRAAGRRPRGAHRAVKPKPPVPLWRWIVWYVTLGVALIVFYGLFTPFWFGLRVLAWVAEYRSRRRRAR